MAVIKLGGSGNSVQFIDEFGNVFTVSRVIVAKMLNNQINGNLVLLSRLPFKTAPNRYPESKVYNPENLPVPSLLPDDSLKASNDGFSTKVKVARKQKKSFEDKIVF